MGTAAETSTFDELRVTARPIEGGKCAQCGRPIGILLVNGHAIDVAPTALVIAGGTFLFSQHLCPAKPTDLGPVKRNGANGRKR